ncbi:MULTISPECIES: GNAT family N-acetyltransferase [unclassified Saccharothrix]|uniref:GNAT family N-acetyltransferase n=1 Tax=unclassified Saccharothrix TaxID=2593673 RepID=UPI00307E5E4C
MYGQALAAALRLHDGREVWMAPLRPDDREELAEAIRRADLDTLFQRFCGAPPPVTPALLAHLTELDHVRRHALVARDRDGRGVGIGRYEATRTPHVAEVAIAVAPGWRRVGLGTLLVRQLSDTALRNGFRWFSVTHLPGNRAVTRMLRAAGAVRVAPDAEALVRCRPWAGQARAGYETPTR